MIEECAGLSDIELLKYYAKQWERYTTGATYVNKLFNYLNKHWVKREKDEGRKEVYTVYTVRSAPGHCLIQELMNSWLLSLGSKASLSTFTRTRVSRN